MKDSLFAQARAISGLRGDGPLINAALHALILREGSQRLVSMARVQRDGKFGAHRPDFDL